jgi:hypothetical protein
VGDGAVSEMVGKKLQQSTYRVGRRAGVTLC